MEDLVAIARVRAAQAIQRRLLGPIAGQIPANYIRSIEERLYDDRIARHVVSMWLRTPATIEHYDFPVEFPPYFRRCKSFDDRYGYLLNDVYVSPKSGLSWLPGGPILEESYGPLIRSLGWGDVRRELLTPSREVSGTVVTVCATGYFHWLLEALPAAVFSLSKEPAATLLLPRDPPRYVEDIVEVLAPERVIRCAGPCRAERCVVAAIEPFSGFVQRAEIARLREAIPVFDSGDASSEMIYVSRRRDRARALTNEPEVEAALRGRGIAIVYAQDLTVAEQQRVFASARVVIGPHGAGLSNLVWATKLEQVIELFPSYPFNDCYARLSRNLGAQYTYLVAAEAATGAGNVPIDELLSLIC